MKVKTSIKAENGKLYKVLTYPNGNTVEIPVNADGSVKWFDDSKLLKQETRKGNDL